MQVGLVIEVLGESVWGVCGGLLEVYWRFVGGSEWMLRAGYVQTQTGFTGLSAEPEIWSPFRLLEYGFWGPRGVSFVFPTQTQRAELNYPTLGRPHAWGAGG
jgi:hypothetical protein